MKNIVIIGGTGGIGEAIVKKFVEEEYHIIFTYCNSFKQAEELVVKYRNENLLLKPIYLDVSSESSRVKFQECVEQEFECIDGIVYCSGIVKDSAMVMMRDEDFERVIDINLAGCFYCIKKLLPMVNIRGGASIVLVSSTGGIRPDGGQTNYAASKAGLIGMMESMAREYARKKIRVNAVAPGFINTQMVNLENKKIQKSIGEIPMKRLGEPQEVANAVYFLYSDKASYITAQTLIVDGGRL